MMQKIILLLLALSSYNPQKIDKHGNPIFNSINIDEYNYGKYIISSNYYTIKNNIEDENSSVFVSEKPTLEQILYFAQNNPSYNFVVMDSRRNVVSGILLWQTCEGGLNNYTYVIMNQNNQRVEKVTVTLPGVLTEDRVTELVNNKYDSNSKIITVDGLPYCEYDNQKYSILPYD